MADDVVVRVEGVAKKFARSLKRSFVYGARDIGRLLLGRTTDDTLRESEFWAVRDVSFTLRAGRSIGIIGHNGSGKTTLLRMVCGILRPSLGSVHVAGRIAPMLALGAGFKPVLSGRQNVFLNLALLGVSERDIRARYDSIVDFAELHDAMDAPLGTYSSGMQARLGFACAVHTKPSILVVDEVLSVGDARFRVKCRNTINELRRNGTSLLLVSHSAALVETLSDECLWLQNGRTMQLGQPTTVLRAYEAETARHANQVTNRRVQDATKVVAGPHDLRITSVEFGGTSTALEGDGDDGGGGGDASACWIAGRDADITVQIAGPSLADDLSINVMVFDLTQPGIDAVLFLSSSRDLGWLRMQQKSATVRLRFPALGLRAGAYRIKVSVSRGVLHDILAVLDDLRIVVRSPDPSTTSVFHQNRIWEAIGTACSPQPTGLSIAAPTTAPFNCELQVAPSWMRRAEVAADLLAHLLAARRQTTRCSLADVGCGDGKLERAVQAHGLAIDHYGFDLHPQRPEVTRFDASSDTLPRPFDVAALLGVTEYLPDLAAALRRLGGRAEHLVVSHVVAERCDYSAEQLDELGWVNHLTTTAFEAALATAGWHAFERASVDDDRTLLLLCRRDLATPR